MITNHSQYLAFAKKLGLEAGKIIMNEYGKTDVSYKQGLDGRPSTITRADEASEKYIVSEIKSVFPTHGIYTEEETKSQIHNDLVWYIDPIDGTTNFWRRIPLFGISIGLAYKNKPIIGVLCFPALDLLVYAQENKGAYANNQKIIVSQRSLNKSLYYISCAESRDGLNFPSLSNKVGWVKAIDASSYELAQIAMGDAELYTFKNVLPHDVVAGTAVLREAGGMVTDEKGQPWKVGAKIIIASNGVIHANVLSLLKTN